MFNKASFSVYSRGVDYNLLKNFRTGGQYLNCNNSYIGKVYTNSFSRELSRYNNVHTTAKKSISNPGLSNISNNETIPISSSKLPPPSNVNFENQNNSIDAASTIPSNKKSSNPPLAFPCIDKMATRTRSLDGGPEPAYEKVVTGYSVYHHALPFLCDYGGVLPKLDIAYETWGELNSRKDNVILLHTGLSASSHAKSHELNVNAGWWENFIGPGLSIDTNKFFVICTNVIGGCYGSTGPGSIDPSNQERYATRFPLLTIFDMVRAQFLLLDHLGVNKLYASVGSSMGGMQSLAAAYLYPDRVSRLISISACARSHPYAIAMRHTQRQVLMADPNWNKGFYYNKIPPHTGMKLAREIATISYRSGPEWEQRFGRKRANEDELPALCPDFLIETYLDHQGERWCLQYDPNSLLYISKAMDLFDMYSTSLERLKRQREIPLSTPPQHSNPNYRRRQKHLSSLYTADTEELDDLVKGLSSIQIPALVLGVQSDILFPYWQQKEVAECLRMGGNKNVTYYELDSMYGHDTFLIDLTNIGSAVKGHLELGG
ncbi:10312_t:CDS:10 [Ambispora leptoticha]|uniref:10312_t:CDS:1 n=1 Tax=Ambispora leptoticha TaxID=144679 RepID=A0A9N8V735_9GLOM|nr:10312_t:CDS:10 [Ambispora leptoticha]